MHTIERSAINTRGLLRIELFEQPEGVYVFVYEAEPPAPSTRDYLLDTLQLAKEQCFEDFGVPLTSWDRVKVEHSPY